jgi:glc operon protein GlcG
LRLQLLNSLPGPGRRAHYSATTSGDFRMRASLLTPCLFLAAALTTPAQAQTAAPAARLDGVPFDVPYGTPVNADTATLMMAAVKAEATKHPCKMNIAVVDTHGEPVGFLRMDGAQYGSIGVSQGKARTAARYRPDVTTLDPTLVASPGVLPLVDADRIIGAIGCSGGTGDQGAAACKAGADLVK